MARAWEINISDDPPLSSPRAGGNNLAPPLSSISKKNITKFDIRLARKLQADGWSNGDIAEASGYSVQFVNARMKQPKQAFTGGYGNGLLTVGKPDRLLELLIKEHGVRA